MADRWVGAAALPGRWGRHRWRATGRSGGLPEGGITALRRHGGPPLAFVWHIAPAPRWHACARRPPAHLRHHPGLWVLQQRKLAQVPAAFQPVAPQSCVQVAKRGGGVGQELQAEHLAAAGGRQGARDRAALRFHGARTQGACKDGWLAGGRQRAVGRRWQVSEQAGRSSKSPPCDCAADQAGGSAANDSGAPLTSGPRP